MQLHNHLFNDEISTKLLPAFVQKRVFGSFYGHYFSFFALLKLEIAAPYGSKQVCKMAVEQLKVMGEDPFSWPINECRMSAGLFDPQVVPLVEVSAYSDPDDLQTFVRQLQAHPQLPFYLYSGGLDSIVPIATFTEEVQLLGARVHYQNFPNAGHDAFYTELAIWSALDREVSRSAAERLRKF